MDAKETADYQLPTTSGKKRTIYALLVVLVLCGCGVNPTHEISRIALLAPFEGRYREVGYNAYYAARLALTDSGSPDVELLALDDGGSVSGAVDRAKALEKDPLVKTVLVLGYAAADREAQVAFEMLPVLIVGQWDSQPEQDHVFMLASSQLSDLVSTPRKFSLTDARDLKTPIIGGEVFALEQFTRLRQDTEGIEMVSSATLPEEGFRERYLNSGLFVPEPGLLATLTYDATNMALRAIQSQDSRTSLASMTYTGINGVIRFENGYWADAPIHYYCYMSSGAGSDGGNEVLHGCENSSSR